VTDLLTQKNIGEARRHQMLYEAAKEYLRPYHQQFEDQYTFLFWSDHYSTDSQNERDARRLKPKGRQLFSKYRYILAQLMKQALHIRTRPVDDVTDPLLAADARWLLEYAINDPQRGFRAKLRDALGLMVGCGVGALTLRVARAGMPNPMVLPEMTDPRDWFWAPGYSDPGDILCPWVMRWGRMRIADIERMGDRDIYGDSAWENVKDLYAEDPYGSRIEGGQSRETGRPLNAYGSTINGPGSWAYNDSVNLLWTWHRYDPKRDRRNSGARILNESERYYACGKCGHTDRSEDGKDLPQLGPICPACNSDFMWRVDRENALESVLAFPEGRLVISTVHQDRVFYDGPWPYKMRNVPLAMFKNYRLPLEPWAQSETFFDWSDQVMLNAGKRRGYEQLTRAGGIIITTMDGLWDARGQQPFEFSDLPLQIARWRGQGKPAVDFFQPKGLPDELVAFMQMVNNDFRADIGIGQLNLTPDQTRDIPVGTVTRLERSGDTPVDDKGATVRETLSPWIGTWYDLEKATMTDRVARRMRGPNGEEMVRRMRGEELPNIDVIVTNEDSWDDFDMERAEKIMPIMQQQDPKMRRFMMRVAGAPADLVDELERIIPAQRPGVPGAAPGMPQEQSPLPAPPVEGVANAG